MDENKGFELVLDGVETKEEPEVQELETVLAGVDAEAAKDAAPLEVAVEVTDIVAEDAPKYMQDVQLTEAERQMVTDFSQKIDLHDTNIVLAYGSSCQKKIAAFSDNALEGVKTKDLDEVGGMITDLVTELKGFDVDEEAKGLKALFKKKGNKLSALVNKFDSAEDNVNKIVVNLEGHQDQLTKDIVMLDEMYAVNLDYFKELTMYIIAGKEKLEQERNTTLVELQKKAEESGLAEDAQAASDFGAQCDRFEKKLADLEITRTISVQMAPQIRLIQNSDTLMVEKIQTTINNTIPLWKNQMVLALGLAHSEQAVAAQKAVSELTNELLKENAEKVHQGAVEIAKESERGIVDIETIQYTNEKLVTTLDEVLAIQQDGHAKRVAAEAELARIETELKNKLLEMSQPKE